jgi:hypothetical protein
MIPIELGCPLPKHRADGRNRALEFEESSFCKATLRVVKVVVIRLHYESRTFKRKIPTRNT